MIEKTIENDTLDAVFFRHFGFVTSLGLGLLIALNPELPEYGPTLPAGVEVRMPDASEFSEDKPTIKLWD